jgi:hypothetical protein
MREEVANYIDKCYEFEEQTKYADVYVTDHKAVDAKHTTQNEEEDAEFFEYQQSIDNYNDDKGSVVTYGKK